MKHFFIALFVLIFLLIGMNLASALSIDSVSLVSEIKPGETSSILIALDNNGNDDIEDVSVVLDLTEVPFAPFDSSSEYSIDEIREGKTKIAEFEIIALNNAKSGIYKIPVKISFRNADDEIIERKSLLSIVVNSKPIIDVSVEEGLLLKNQDNELSVRITNKGLSDAKFLEVELERSKYIDVISSKKFYIGDVDSDDFDSVQFKVFFKSDTPERFSLPVEVIYKDDLNQGYVEEFDVVVNVYSRDRAIQLGLIDRNLTYVYVILAVVIIVIIYIYRRTRIMTREKKLKAQKDEGKEINI